MQTMEQKRAKYALEQVQGDNGRQDIQDKYHKYYKSYASSFPAMIQINGLGQAAAFYRSKGAGVDTKAKAYRALYELLSVWLLKPGQPYHGCEDLLDGIITKNIHAYQLAQAEALALLNWVKKFATAFMEGE